MNFIQDQARNETIEVDLLEIVGGYGVSTEHAFRCAQKLMFNASRAHHTRGMIVGLRYLGNYQRVVGDYERAEHTLTQALGSAREAAEVAEEARIHQAFASLRHDQGDLENSLSYITTAEALFRETNETSGSADCSLMKANIFITAKNATEAIQNANTALGLYARLEKERGIAGAYATLGLAYGLAENFPKAIEFSLKARPYFQDFKQVYNLATLNCNLGEIYFKMHDLRNALPCFEAALRFEGLDEHPYLAVGLYCNYALALAEKGDTELAALNLQIAQAIAERVKNPALLKDCVLCFESINISD